MLDDKDEFQKTSIYAECLLQEAKDLIELWRTSQSTSMVGGYALGGVGLMVPPVSWNKIIRNFMVKHDDELNEVIDMALSREQNVP